MRIDMKKDNKVIALLILGTFIIELLFFNLLQFSTTLYEDYYVANRLVPSILYLVFTFLNYSVILPRISNKLLSNKDKAFKSFLLFNIIFNVFSGVFGPFTYLYFVLINPTVLSISSLIELLKNPVGIVGNILYYIALTVITFIKPFVLKLSLKALNKQ